MKKKFKLSTALDVDDLLMECVPYAVKLANEKYKFDPPLSIYEFDRWGKLGTRADVIFEFFEDPEFFKNQPVIKGAHEFVKKLSKKTEVFISTSIIPKFMGIRAQRIIDEFPEIPPEHIYMGARKDKLDVDILFDDGMHNVLKSNAAYPILMRKPWNRSATGMLAVNNYDEFLKLVDIISFGADDDGNWAKNTDIIVLVGPSGSGKNKIAEALIERSGKIKKLISYTTDPQYDEKRYKYIDSNSFFAMMERGEFFESTMYASVGYGTKISDVNDIISEGKIVLAIMDICGAMAMKTKFKNVKTIYIDKNKKQLLSKILEKNCSNAEKVNRIISIDDEKRNAEICDAVIENVNIEDSVTSILNRLGL